jgi:hypothetical protein
LVAEKRSMRTHFCQDLCRDQGTCPECGDMARAAGQGQPGYSRPWTCRIRDAQLEAGSRAWSGDVGGLVEGVEGYEDEGGRENPVTVAGEGVGDAVVADEQ